MAIDRLSSTAALIAALRSDVLRRTEQAPRAAGASASRPDTPSRPSAPTVDQLRNQLVEIVREVDPADSQAVRHARARCIRRILLWEFGEEFREHPEWRPLMDRIDSAFEGDEAQSVMFVKLISSLQSHSQRPSRTLDK